MPICRTCRGEYEQKKPACSSSGRTSKRNDSSCAAGPQVCPRCGSDVSVWEQMDINLSKFILREGGIMGLMPAALALAVWLLFWTPREVSMYYYPLLTAMSFGFSVLSFFIIYAERLMWWEHWWAGQVYRMRSMPIISVIVAAAIAGVLLSTLWLLIYTTSGRPADLVGKGLFAFIYVMSYICLTVAITLEVVHQYVERLKKSVPPPIFVSTRRLTHVVADAAIQSINLIPSGICVSSVLDHAKPVCEVFGALRRPEDGGIDVLLRERKLIPYPAADGQMQKRWTEVFWRIKADRWGHIQTLQPELIESSQDYRRILGEI